MSSSVSWLLHKAQRVKSEFFWSDQRNDYERGCEVEVTISLYLSLRNDRALSALC